MMWKDKTTGDMIQHDFMGQMGMQTGSFANTLTLEQRKKQQAAAREARRRELARPVQLSPPVFPLTEKLVRPPIGDPVKFQSGPNTPKAPHRIPAWKWYLAGCLTGLILPYFF